MGGSKVTLICLVFTAFVLNSSCAQKSFSSLVIKPYLENEKMKSSIAASLFQRFRRDIIETTDYSNIKTLHILSRITSRFCDTTIQSRVENQNDAAQEIKFIVQIPETAFIANFTMLVNGSLLVAEVMEKEAAQKRYDEAKDKGETAGQVKSEAKRPQRGFDLFSIAVNVAGLSEVTFQVTYQELLVRELGFYIVQTSVRPDQIVDDLEVDFYIYEPEGIDYIEADAPVGGTASAFIIHQSETVKHVSYHPSTTQQGVDGGLNGDVRVRYDIVHDNSGGKIYVQDGYFVHYFAPTGLTPMNKNILFIVDISGSMGGGGETSKMAMARNAMVDILDQLDPHDGFDVLIFDDKIELWQGRIVQANTANVLNAKSWVENKFVADGSTNINDALVTGIGIMKAVSESLTKAGIIVFLTDGEPSEGVTDTSQILDNVDEVNNGQISIYSLAFGTGISFDFLEALSVNNGGSARLIYDETDAPDQLKQFYKTKSIALLVNVRVEYLDNTIDVSSITKTLFSEYFNGSEIVVAGKLNDANINNNVGCTVYGNTETNEIELSANVASEMPVVSVGAISNIAITRFTEKLWAYMKIKDLIRMHLVEKNEAEKSLLKSKAVNMSIEYHFVTPLTSMVIVQKDYNNQQESADMSNGMASGAGFSRSSTLLCSKMRILQLTIFCLVLLRG